MNKFIKIGATLLFTLFLTACDKPADKSDTEKMSPETTQSQHTATPPVNVKTEVVVQEISPEKQELIDYQKILDWSSKQYNKQILSQQKFQADLQAAVEAKDNKKIQDAIETFNTSVNETIASLDSIELKSDAIKDIRDQSKRVLQLTSDLLISQIKTLDSKDQSAIEDYKNKAEQLQSAVTKLQQDDAALAKKFALTTQQPSVQDKQQPETK